MVRRNITRSVELALADTPVVLLNGARQTGKSTLIKALASASGHRYLTLDDPAVAAAATADPSGFLTGLSGRVVIDEVQRVPELFPVIKLAVDENRVPGRFLLTGSANVLTLPRLSESLAGRMEVIPLYPFSAGEIEGRAESFVSRLFRGDPVGEATRETRDSLLNRVVAGGYPEAVERRDPERRAAWFASYTATILQRDVRDLARVDVLRSLPHLLQVLAARTSGLLNQADIARDAGLSYTTLLRHLALLETVFLVQLVPAWSRNLGTRLVKSPKLHLVDTGLAAYLLGADAERLMRDVALRGRLVESWVVGELRKQLSWNSPRTRLYHFRTATGREVDVVLEAPDGAVVALEVKSGATVRPDDFAALATLRQELGDSFRAGVVLYLGEASVPFGDRLWALPLPTLWQ